MVNTLVSTNSYTNCIVFTLFLLELFFFYLVLFLSFEIFCKSGIVYEICTCNVNISKELPFSFLLFLCIDL